MTGGSAKLRLGVVLDAGLEGWTSMDYVGEMLVETLRNEHPADVEVSTLQPCAPKVLSRFPGASQALRENVDRFLTRCLVYPALVGRRRLDFDVFHIVDHSYAHTAHVLPPERTGIYCHDLDALRPLLSGSRWSSPQRAFAWSILRALQRVALIFYNSEYVRTQISSLGTIDDKKLFHASLGIAAEFSLRGPVDAEIDRRLPPGRFLLHVGSGIPRKRLELLFRAFAVLRAKQPHIVLVQQGAALSGQQLALLEQLGIEPSVIRLPALSRTALAHLYRRATLVVLPSEREGFGLPVIEALACGTPVLASDIPAFREVGGHAISFCQGSDPDIWASAIQCVLLRERSVQQVADGLAHVARFSWSAHAQTILNAYRSIV